MRWRTYGDIAFLPSRNVKKMSCQNLAVGVDRMTKYNTEIPRRLMMSPYHMTN